jgi:phage terminase large subunit-like protein
MAETSPNSKQEIKDLCGSDKPDKVLQELRIVKEEKVFRFQGEKFRFYEPNGKCEEFIRKIGEGDNFVVLFSAANGVGKTAAGANIIAHLVWGKQSANPFFDLPLYKNFPFPKRGRIASDPTNIEKNLIPTLKEWLPDGRYKSRKGNKTYDSIWKTDNGWEWDIMTYEQDAKEYESATLGWCWFDEPPPEAIFKATVARMRKGGIIFISETPLYAAWLYDHIIANPDPELEAKGQRVYIEAEVEDACKTHGIRGHLEHEHIERMIAEYTEDEKQARIYGKFQHLVGLRYKQFSRAIHVIRPFEIKRQDWVVHHALDTHPRVNDAGTWLAIDRNGRKIIVDELWEKCQGGTEELAQRIKNKNDNYRIERKLLEPAAFIEDQHSERSLASRLNDYGLNYIEATKNRTMSDRRIEDALTYQKVNLNNQEEFIKAPELYIFDTCKHTIYEFEHCRWDEWAGKTAERKDQKEKIIDKDDHFLENIGRILIQEPVFVPIIKERSGQNTGQSYDPYDNPIA